MTPPLSVRDLARRGLNAADINRMLNAGTLVRIRRGAYARTSDEPQSVELRHRRLILATLSQVSPDAVVSHSSAAVLHALPVWNAQLARVHLTRNRGHGGKTSRNVRIYPHPLAAGDIVLVDGIAVTSLARTVLDLACQLTLGQAVAVGDAALRAGLNRTELNDLVEAARGRHGIGRARLACRLLDPRSESPEESRSRVVFYLADLPTPELQWLVHDDNGLLVARTDFGWPELGTVGEFDGKVKYGRLLKPGQDVGEVVFKEKQREDAVRDTGLQVVRWISAEVDRPADLLARLQRAFARGRSAR